MALNAIILAGGRGSRMGMASETLQKCMWLVQRIPLLHHLLAVVRAVPDIESVVIATGHRARDVVQYFGDNFEGLAIRYVHDDRHLEDRKRLLLASAMLSDPFVFLAGDVLVPPTLVKEVVQRQFAAEADVLGTISGASDHRPAPSHGVVEIREGRAVRIDHPFRGTLSPFHYREMGISCLSTRLFPALEDADESMIHISHVLSREIAKRQPIRAVAYEGEWNHYAVPEDFELPVPFG